MFEFLKQTLVGHVITSLQRGNHFVHESHFAVAQTLNDGKSVFLHIGCYGFGWRRRYLDTQRMRRSSQLCSADRTDDDGLTVVGIAFVGTESKSREYAFGQTMGEAVDISGDQRGLPFDDDAFGQTLCEYNLDRLTQ